MRIRKLLFVGGIFMAGVVGGWTLRSGGLRPPDVRAAPRFPPPPVAAGQNGLSDGDRAGFYHLSEGGELYPVDWLLALDVEVPASDGSILVRPFLDTVDRYGLLPDAKHAGNPYGLPVGISFARAKLNGVEMIGLNCSACHVGQVQYQNHAVRIDGGPNMAYINKFLEHLAAETESHVQVAAPARPLLGSAARGASRAACRHDRSARRRRRRNVRPAHAPHVHQQPRPARGPGERPPQRADAQPLAGDQHRGRLRPAGRVWHRPRRALRRDRGQQPAGRRSGQHPPHLGPGVHRLAAVGRQYQLRHGAQHRPGARGRRAVRSEDVREHRAPREPPSAGGTGVQDHAAEVARHVSRHRQRTR